MSSSLVNFSNHFYGGITNTEVSKEQIYSASANKGKLSVLRQVSGTITIPTGTILLDSTIKYLPVLDEDLIQVLIPLHSIIFTVEYSTIPFGSAEAGITAVTLEGFASSQPYSLAVPYSAGASLSVSSNTFTDINKNVVAASSSTGCVGLYCVGGLLNSTGSTITTTQVNVVRVTLYYSDPQDLNN